MVHRFKILWELIRQRDFPTIGLCFAIFLTGVFLLSLPFCPWSQRQIMQKFHLKSDTFAAWAVFQFVPSMYNFDNETWVSQHPFPNQFDDDWNKDRSDTIHYWLNHYPLRYASFSNDMRAKYRKSGQPVYFYIRSRYRQNEMISVYELESPDGRTFNLKRVR